jgi:hypothetical protein
VPFRGTHTWMAFCPGTPNEESRNCKGLGLLQFCGTITPCLNLGLGRGLKRSCSSHRELSNIVSHSTRMHQGQVDPQLLMVETPDLSFSQNQCYRCPNGSSEPIFNIYTSIAFQWYKEHPNVRFFYPCNQTLNFRESRRTPKSPFRECESHPHTLSK